MTIRGWTVISGGRMPLTPPSPPPQLKIFLNFMQNSEILAKSYVGAPWRVGDPPTRNPVSTPEV